MGNPITDPCTFIKIPANKQLISNSAMDQWCQESRIWWQELRSWAQSQHKDCHLRYRVSHYKDKTVMRLSYLYQGDSYTGKMTYLYWEAPLISLGTNHCLHHNNKPQRWHFSHPHAHVSSTTFWNTPTCRKMQRQRYPPAYPGWRTPNCWQSFIFVGGNMVIILVDHRTDLSSAQKHRNLICGIVLEKNK